MSIRGRWALLGLGVFLLVAEACANTDGNDADDGAQPTAVVGTRMTSTSATRPRQARALRLA